MIGRTLSHYEILDSLGAGGMGEVYRARDTKLERDVAIKVLPDELAADPDRLARFEREAKLLAQLNHSNIAGIYGLEEADGVLFIAMECVEGENLAERLAASGRIEVNEALDIARQIAEALEVAHEAGIIHRDLKPANVKITPEGNVKVLDFGLAKAWDAPGEASGADASVATDLTHSPTMMEATRTGVILGTAAYMSPEQARGKPVDKRTDIWALGCVLYEMLVGKRAFDGETVSDIMAAILKEEPAWDALPQELPIELRRTLCRCLQKDPRRRLRDIGDAWIIFAEAGDEGAGWGTELHRPVDAAGSRNSLFWIGIVLTVAVGAIVTGYFWGAAGVPDPVSALPSRLSISLPPERPLASAGVQPLGVGRPSLALSSDGTLLVYVAEHDGTTSLHLRDMSSGEFEPIPQTEGARGPFFSPAGNAVGYFAGEQLMVVDLDGTAPRSLAPVKFEQGGFWAPDGNIYFVETEGATVSSVPVTSPGAVREVARTQPGILGHVSPSLLPDGNTLLFGTSLGLGVAISDLSMSAEPSLVLSPGGHPQYVPTGHLLFAKRGSLWAVPFDLDRLEITGAEVRVVDDLRTEELGNAQYAISADGTLAYVPGNHASVSSFVWVDREENVEPLPLPRADHGAFQLSPDGTLLAFTRHEATGLNTWLYDFDRQVEERLTVGGDLGVPVWSPDLRSLFVQNVNVNGFDIFWVERGGGPPRQLTGARLISTAEVATPDVLIISREVGGVSGLWHVPLEDGRPPPDVEAGLQPLMDSGANEFFADLSPDGDWIAYLSDRSGSWQVYVSPYPEMSSFRQISANGGEEPLWNPLGGEVIYRNGSRWLSVDISVEPEFARGSPEVVFEGSYINVPGYSWSISADGDRFLVLESPDQSRTVTEIAVITNFFDRLVELAPPGR